MSGPLRSILHRELRDGRPLNILLFLSNDCLYDNLLCQTGHNFYVMGKYGKNVWDKTIDKPKNLEFLLDDPPLWLDFDFIIVQNRMDSYSIAEQLSKFWHIPILLINRVCPNSTVQNPNWPLIHSRRGNYSIYLEENIQKSWNQVGSIVRPGVNSIFNSENRPEKLIDVLMLLPQTPPQEELGRIISKEFIVEFLYGKNEEELVKQYKSSAVFVDLNGPEFLLSSIYAVACGCYLVTPKRQEASLYVNENTSGYIENVKDLLEKIKNNINNFGNNTNIEFNSLEKFNEDINYIFKQISEIVYAR